MRVEINMLSKKSLVELVSWLHKAKPFPEKALAALYRQDLTTQIRSIARQLDKIEKNLKDKKISRSSYLDLIKKQNKLAVLGNKKIRILQELDNADQS